jgi:hypothetical protein
MAGVILQMVESLPSKFEVLHSIPSTTKNKQTEKSLKETLLIKTKQKRKNKSEKNKPTKSWSSNVLIIT